MYLLFNCILTGHHHETTINNNTSDANDICDGNILVLRSISKAEFATCMLVVEWLSSWMLKAQAVLALMLSACRKCSQNHFVCCLMIQKYFVHVMILVEQSYKWCGWLILISITIQVVESTQVNTVVGLGTNGYTHLELLLMPSQNSGAPVHQK